MAAFRNLIVPAALLPLALLLSTARGQEDDAEARLGEALETILTRLVKAKTGLRLGITEPEAVRQTPGATDLVGDRILPLAATQYAPKGEWYGTVRILLTGEPGAKLDGIQVCLLCEPYDEPKLARRLVGIGRKLGYAFEADEDAPNTWFDSADHTRDLWVSFGRGVIAIDADLVED